jgi:plasmid maintenance system antidote protein VapI
MDVFKALNYREIVDVKLKGEGKKRPRGIIQRLAESLKCHPTLISQILHNKADLSIDQAILFCEFANFQQDETDHFMDMLFRERAGHPATKRHFEQKIKKRIEVRESFAIRVNAGGSISEEYQQLYYETWIPQVVHICCQIGSKGSTVAELSKSLGIDAHEISEVVSELVKMGLVIRVGDYFKSVVDSLHIGKDHKLTKQIHRNWRLRTIQEFQRSGKIHNTHFSSVISLSESSAEKIKQLIFDHIESISNEVKTSKPETMYSFCLDFYRLLKK